MESGGLHLLLDIWPVIIAILGLTCTNAIAIYRIKIMEKQLALCLTIEAHNKDCKIASLEIKNYFTIALNDFSATFFKKLDAQQQPVLDAIKRNTEYITRLDHRTRHLRDVDDDKK